MQIDIDKQTGCIKISQPGYTKKLLSMLSKFNEAGRKVSVPMSTIQTDMDGDDIKVDQTEYLRAVGGLNYLAQFTRPDLLYSLSRVAQKCSRPTKGDMRRVKRIFKYIESTQDHGITFMPGEIELVCWADSAFNCYEDAKSHYGYAFALGIGDGVFYARSSKMKLTVLSSTEAEYVAACEAARDLVWLRRLLKELGFAQEEPTILFQDNMSTIHMLNRKGQHKASKHIRPKYHFTRDQVKKGNIKIVYLETKLMIADILTKPLEREVFTRLAAEMLNL
jgi:hypothetical protein